MLEKFYKVTGVTDSVINTCKTLFITKCLVDRSTDGWQSKEDCRIAKQGY
ncbi:MAG: hypothetical protein QUS12_13170 [Methanosarcina sp.]|nr:hypothetical protein [Methanosarcina sp.]